MSQQLTIYSWDRCPDCTRLKFVLYLKNIPFTEIIVDNDTLQGEVEQMLGKMCVPALKLDDGTVIDDSIHALQTLDTKLGDMVLKSNRYGEIEQWLENFAPTYRSLIAPFWVHLPLREFQNPDILNRYVENVLNVTGHSIDELIANKNNFINDAIAQMEQLSEIIFDNSNPNYLYSVDELNLIDRLYWLAHLPDVYEKMPELIKKYIDYALLHSKMPMRLDV